MLTGIIIQTASVTSSRLVLMQNLGPPLYLPLSKGGDEEGVASASASYASLLGMTLDLFKGFPKRQTRRESWLKYDARGRMIDDRGVPRLRFEPDAILWV